MPGKLGDQRDLGLHPLQDDGVDPVHIGGDERQKRVERGLALGMKRMNSGGHGHRP